MTRILLLVCLLFLPSLAEAAVGSAAVDTWYVRPTGACANNGDGLAYGCAASSGATGAFKGFSNIIWTATTGVDNGDTLYVCGTHTTTLRNDSASGISGFPITISGACPSDPGSINTSTGALHTDGLQVLNQSWVTVRNFAMLTGEWSAIKIYNSTGVAMTGISILNNTIDNRTASDPTQNCNEIWFYPEVSPAGSTFTNVTITGNTLLGTPWGGCGSGINHGIVVFKPTLNLLIADNYIYDTSGDSITTSGAFGTNLVITRNYVSGGKYGGFKIQHAGIGCTSGITLTSNLIINNYSWGIILIGTSNSLVANNTVIGFNDGDIGGAGPTFGPIIQYSDGNDVGCAQSPNTYLNNIFTGNYAPGISMNYLFTRAGFQATETWNGNVFWQRGAQTNLFGFTSDPGNNVTMANFATWKTAHPKDLNILPTFVNSTACTSQATQAGCRASDWHLAPGSPLIGAGVSYAGCVDFTGTPCPNPPSIGAYQVAGGASPWPAASCNNADIQAVLDDARTVAGDTVLVPAGNCIWTTSFTSNKPNQNGSVVIRKNNITLRGAGIGQTIINPRFAGGRQGGGIVIQGGVTGAVITGFTFDGELLAGTQQAIVAGGWNTRNPATDFRIHHNKFQNQGQLTNGGIGAYLIETWAASYGLIDNNTFENIHGEGIYVNGDGTPGWDRTPLVGGYTNRTVFVEDNLFTMSTCIGAAGDPGKCGNAIDGGEGGRFVFRHNRMYGTATTKWNQPVESHGFCVCESLCAGTLFDIRGNVSTEIYENDISIGAEFDTTAVGGRFFSTRGGTGVIFHNRLYGNTQSVDLRNERSQNPAYDSSGPGCSGASTQTPPGAQYSREAHVQNLTGICEGCGGIFGTMRDQVQSFYIWDNLKNGSETTFNASVAVFATDGVYTLQDIVLNTNYFLEIPRPGYVSYPYPHPLQGVVGDTIPPAAPTNITVQ